MLTTSSRTAARRVLNMMITLASLIALLSHVADTSGRAHRAALEECSASEAVMPWAVLGNSHIGLRDAVEVKSRYRGSESAMQALEANQAKPLAIASADFDEDGVMDIVCSYGSGRGGILALYRGNVDSIYENAPEAQARRRAGEFIDSPFLTTVGVFELSHPADFIGVGDFDADRHFDLVTAEAGGASLRFLRGDGSGGFSEASRSDLPGFFTAMTTGEINRADGLADVVVAVVTPAGPKVLVFESMEGASKATPEILDLPALAGSLALGQLDDDAAVDLAVGAGSEVLIIGGRDRMLGFSERARAEVHAPVMQIYSAPFVIAAMTMGNFGGDARAEIALMGKAGNLSLMNRSAKEAPSREGGASWQMKSYPPVAVAQTDSHSAPSLITTRTTAHSSDDLVVIDQSSHQLRLLTGEEFREESSGESTSSGASLDLGSGPVAVAPMRLNSDALRDLVILRSGNSKPVVSLTAPAIIFEVSNTNVNGPGSLFVAIGNADSGDTITFNIPGAGVHTIDMSLNRGRIVGKALTIDGTTQPGFSGTPLIELTGTASEQLAGLTLENNNGTTIRGLAINRFGQFGISAIGGSGNIVEGNFIGTEPSGASALPNGGGVHVHNDQGNSVIGGTTAAARNVISGNNGQGIEITGGVTGVGNLVQGNYIGTNAAGNAALGNSGNGVSLFGIFGLIGGTVAGARNVISGNGINGIRIDPGEFAFYGYVEGNYIGTDASGLARIRNLSNGVFLFSVSGISVDRNIISGNNAGAGIRIEQTTQNFVSGNYIGTNASGSAALNNETGILLINSVGNLIGSPLNGNLVSGNSGNITIQEGSNVNELYGNLIGTDITGTFSLGGGGLYISDSLDNTIGGSSSPLVRNVISGNDGWGVSVLYTGGGNVVDGNFIGTTKNGNAPLPNTFGGVIIHSSVNNRLVANTIAYNNGPGVFITNGGLGIGPGTGNRLGWLGQGNSIFSNAGPGIDLNNTTAIPDGVTPNDSCDPDTGANNLQNFPVLTRVTSDVNGTTYDGYLDSPGSFTLDFYLNDDCDPSGYGEGKQLIATANMTGGCPATFSIHTANVTPSLKFITAIATNTAGDTSEFSKCAQVNAPDLSITKTDSPDPVMKNGTLTYTITVTNNGTETATGAVMTDALPAGMTFVSASTGCAPSGNTVTCNLGSLAPSASSAVSVVVTPTLSGSIINTATVQCDQIDPDLTNNTASSTTYVFSTLVVNSTGDGADSNLNDGVCNDGSGNCTLRAAIQQANFNTGPENISFNIPGAGVHTITPLSLLPNITGPVVIDGYTQPGASPNTLAVGNDAVLLIELNGANAIPPLTSFDGLLVLTAGNSTVRGLVVNRFVPPNVNNIGGFGISLHTGGNNVVEGCFIGIDPTGTIARKDHVAGILLDSQNNLIGGTTPAARNVVADGMKVQKPNNQVKGNYLGTNAAASASLSTSTDGVRIVDTQDISIGGTTAAERNVMATNSAGVYVINSSNITIQGNYFGTNATGAAGISPGNGIRLEGATNITIGGLTPMPGVAPGNVISGHAGYAIDRNTGNGITIRGNLIGTNAGGTDRSGNGAFGVRLANGTGGIIGGTTPQARNVISGVHLQGAVILGTGESGAIVQGNYIGLAIDGTTVLGNGNGGNGSGVLIEGGNNNTIGGTTAGAANIIAGSASRSVNVSVGAGNAIRGNSMFGAAFFGLDLGGAGVTANDSCDADTGANNLQNFPVLTSASSSGGSTIIAGTLNSTANTSFTLDFYANLICNPQGYGEGKTFFGSINVSTDGSCNASFAATLPTSVPTGQIITATATNPGGSTSEFSACRQVAAGSTIPAGTYSNVFISSGTTVTLTGDITVTGNLTLNGDLDTAGFTLTMPATATSSGTGDVIGNVRRTGFVLGTPLSFGNPFNTIQFDSGTPPTEVTINLVKSAPASYTNAVQRTYTITPTGGSGWTATLRLHYLDAELNGNDETTVQLYRGDGGAWDSQGATSRDASDNWVEKTGVTAFSPWVIGGPGGPTAIELISFEAKAYDNGALLEWLTGFEVDNLGFNIYREQSGRRELVNPQMIAGSALVAGSGVVMRAGRSYAWWDKGIGDCRLSIADCQNAMYWLEDVDINGKSRLHGPFAVKVIGGVPPDQSRAAMLSQIGASQPEVIGRPSSGFDREPGTKTPSDTAQVQHSLASSPAVKLSVREEGWYRATQPELITGGIDSSVDPRNLQLFVDGVEQAILVVGENDGRFDSLDAVEFYGRGLDTPSTDTRVYWLALGKERGKRINIIASHSKPVDGGSFSYTVERKERGVYFSALLNGDAENFFGRVVASQPVEQTIPVNHLDTTSPAAEVEVALQGVTDVAGSADHQVSVALNGVMIGRLVFDGREHKVESFSINAALLKEGENAVTLTGQGGADVTLVDYTHISYNHTYAADNDALKTTVSNASQTIEGFSTPLIRVVDVTDSTAVVELSGQIDARKDGSFAVTVDAPGPERTLLAFADSRIKQPGSITGNRPSNWRSASNGADMLVITRGDLVMSLEPLRALRQAQGLSVAMADIEDIYDEFNYGEKSPQALKDFIGYATTSWKTKPRFVLLAGDASFDSRNYLGFGDNDLVPTGLIDTVFMETASDEWLGDLNNDALAEVAMGRLPVRTPSEASKMVAKIVGYERSSGSRELLLVSDESTGYDFEGASARLMPLTPADLRVDRIDRGRLEAEAAKKLLIEAINRGQKIVNYAGHGSANTWNGSLLTVADARGLQNLGRLPLFVMMTCLNGYFHDTAIDSLSESLMKADGGAIAVWASTGMTGPYDQWTMNEELYRAIFGASGFKEQALTIGEAAVKAKAKIMDSDVRRTWVLLGDPAMKLR